MTDSSSLIGLTIATCARRRSSSGRRSCASRAVDSKLQPTTSSSPRPTSTSSARRRRRCAGVSRPTAPRRRGSVAGSWSLTPCRRATSSIRSASRVMSLRRNGGTVTSRPFGRSAVSKPSRLRCSALSERVMPTPSSAPTFASRRRIVSGAMGSCARRATSTVPGTSRAPVSSSISCVATACPSSACSGARPFSKRALASLRSPSCSDVAWMFAASQLAASISTAVVSSCTSERLPPMTPAIDVGPSSSAISTTSSSTTRVWSSSVIDLLARGRAAHDEPAPGDAVEVEGVHRLPGQQHHVVRDVDDVVDRALAGGHQARLQPGRRGADRDVRERPRGEARAEVGRLDDDLARRCASASSNDPGSSDHGGGASGAPVAACTSRATP